MTTEASINAELTRLKLEPLNVEQLECLADPSRVDEAAAMLADLRDRCMVSLPMPNGVSLGGPFVGEDAAEDAAQRHAAEHPVVAVDEMATDESRSTGVGNEFYVTGYSRADAAIVLAERDQFVAVWVAGEKRTLDA